ncbi:MAG: hypothetical protein ABWX63_08985 [Paeniglutamicibacter terrestris]
MNPLELNAYDIIIYIVGFASLALVVWVLVKVGKYASQRSPAADKVLPTTKNDDSESE